MSEFLYHYTPCDLKPGDTLKPGSWLTDSKGCAFSEKIGESASDGVILFECIILTKIESLIPKNGHKRPKVKWYQVKDNGHAEVRTVKPVSISEMRERRNDLRAQ